MALNHKGKIHKAETGLRFIDIFIVHYRELHSGYDRLHIPFQSKKAATSPSTFRQATVLTASYQFRPSDGVRCVLLRLAKIIPEDHRYHSTCTSVTPSLAPITNHVTPK